MELMRKYDELIKSIPLAEAFFSQLAIGNTGHISIR